MKSAKWIDVSVALAPGQTPTWPGSPTMTFEPRLSLARGDKATDTTMRMSVHTGTHIDAPAHFVAGGRPVDHIGLDRLIGPCWVAAIAGAGAIDASRLEQAAIPADTERLLLKTDNSGRWSARFDPSYIALDVSGARWLVERGIGVVGIDYLSIQAWNASDEVHVALLNEEAVIIEGLDLSQAPVGPCELMCLPLKLAGVEAAPARVLIRPTQSR